MHDGPTTEKTVSALHEAIGLEDIIQGFNLIHSADEGIRPYDLKHSGLTCRATHCPL